VVTTAMLPTVVPAGTENLSVSAELTEPMATVPKFWLAESPVKVTCALAVTGDASAARKKSDKEMHAAIRENSLVSTNPVARLGRCIEARIAVSVRGGLRLFIYMFARKIQQYHNETGPL
jgi:hypothetical protein